jgi:hypothetical protein
MEFDSYFFQFYANLFAKVFCYLEENDPNQEWVAVAIFLSRNEEPKSLETYTDLLESPRVKRVYLTDLQLPSAACRSAARIGAFAACYRFKGTHANACRSAGRANARRIWR